MQPGIPQETAVRVYRRYLRLEPTHSEEYIAYLKSKVHCCLPCSAHSLLIHMQSSASIDAHSSSTWCEEHLDCVRDFNKEVSRA